MIRKNYGLFLKTDAVVGILAKSFLTLKNSLTSTLPLLDLFKDAMPEIPLIYVK
jgi:hypothetical protein